MADDTASQQLDEWKQKYYASLASLEQQQGYDELLQRSLGRLALAAQGLDPALDKQLKSLRDVLRGKKEQQEIEEILNKMEKAITLMEETAAQDNSLSTGKIVAELLLSLKLAKQFKAEVKTLAKQLSPATNQAMPALIPQVLSLLDRIVNQSPSEKNLVLALIFLVKVNLQKKNQLAILK